jgi:hypothetical protein
MVADAVPRTDETAGGGIELALVLCIGLAIPFADFPLRVWRGFGIDLAHLAGGALVAWSGLRALARRRALPPRDLSVGAAAFLLCGVGAWVLPKVDGFQAGALARTGLHLLFFLLLFLAIASSPFAGVRLSSIARWLAGEAAFLAVYGMFQVAALSRGWPSGWELLNRFAWHPIRAQGLVWRATATFEEPKWLAIHLLFGIASSYGAYLSARSAAGRRAWALAAAAMLGCIVATGSLGMLPAAVFLLLLAAADQALRVRRIPARRFALLSAAVALVAAAAVAFAPGKQAGYLRDRIAGEVGTLRDRSNVTEIASGYKYANNVRFAAAMFLERPVFGIGLGEFAHVGARRGVALGIPAEFTRDGPWVGWIGLLAEAGVAGAAAMAYLLWRILRRREEASPDARAFAILLVAAVLAKEASSGFYVHFWTWYPLGLAACATRFRIVSRQ